MFICLFPGSRVTTDQRVVAKQEIQEVESAKRAGAPYAHHRYQARDTNTKLRLQLANAPRARRYRDKRLRGLGKGDVRGVVEVVLGEHLPKPTP